MFKCSGCGNNVFSFNTQKHATDEGATSYEMNNIGEHISVDPTEHTADFISTDEPTA